MLVNTIKNLKKFKLPSVLGPATPIQHFAIYTSQANVVKRAERPAAYSRELLKLKNESPTPEELKRMEDERIRLETEKRVFMNKANDKNPSNHVKVKINSFQNVLPQTDNNPLLQAPSLINPFVLLVTPRPIKPFVKGLRRKVPSCMKKVIPWMRAITGKHLYDAISILQNSHTKAAKYVLYTLQMVRRHGLQKQMDEERFYVAEAMSGKLKRTTRLRYHAKGKSGLMVRDSTQLTIKLEERTVEHMFKEMMNGRAPPMLAYLMKRRLVEKDVDYDVLRKNNFLLTARGRQQRKLMFKRRVITKFLEYKKVGEYVPYKLIAKNILEEEAKIFADRFRQMKLDEIKTGLSARQAVFNRNEELTK